MIDKKTNEVQRFYNDEFLTYKQQTRLNTPDVIWQMAQKIKKYYQEKDLDVAVYVVQSDIRVNSRDAKRLIDPTVDLASEEWNHFKHHDWILDENAPQDLFSNTDLNKIPVQIIPQK